MNSVSDRPNNGFFKKDFFSPLNIARLIWARKLIVAAFALAGAVLGILYAVITPTTYVSSMIVGPQDAVMSNSNNGLLSQIGQFAGVTLNSPGDGQVQMYRLLMSGTRVATRMQDKYQLLQKMLPDAWNAQENRWKRRDEVSLGVRGNIKEMLGLLRWTEPDANTLATLLGAQIIFVNLARTPYYQVSYRSADPRRGAELLAQLNEAVNFVYNEGLAKETQGQIDYIDNMLRTETRENVRAVQLRLLSDYSN